MLSLEDDGHCFACGPKNPGGLKLAFSREGGKVRAVFTLGKVHQGYRDVVHGGIISAVMDEAMIKAALETGVAPVTVELMVRFKKTLMVGEEAVVEATLERPQGSKRLIEASAVLRKASDGTLVATGRAKLLRHE